MQVTNVNLPITVTGRHVSVTEAMRDYAHKKVEGLHLDYPKIIEAKVILDVEANRRQIAEIILFCANHITIEADTEGTDIYAAIDETIQKIARRMRKYKTRLLKKHRARAESIKHIPEEIYNEESLNGDVEEIEPVIIHQENYNIRPLFPDEALMDLELSERPFIVFKNQKTQRISIVYRRKDGDYGMIDPTAEK